MKEVYFKTNVLLKNIIGKDLITNDNMAVLELVKNSFDAGSPSVNIIFENLINSDDSISLNHPTSDTSRLIIKDLGIGMSEDDLINKWLNIAFSEKKEEKERFGRVLAGNKGVGRFSCDRLGRFLTIYTKKKDTLYNKLFIDWHKFEIEGEQDFKIQDVKLVIETIDISRFQKETGFELFDSGTILDIAMLRENWSVPKILNLKRDLQRLLNPNQIYTKNPFSIYIDAKDFYDYDNKVKNNQKISGLVQNQIFQTLDFKTTSISSKISPDGVSIMTILKDRGIDIFTLKEKNPYPNLRNIEINIFYLNTYAKTYFYKQTGIRAKNFGSIYLFLNGFRVPPYGDEGDDWLGMETRKGQGYNRFLGSRELVGRIEINDNDNEFNIISNREGLVKNLPYEQLTHSTTPYGLYYKTFRRLERFVVEGIGWDKTSEKLIEEDSTEDINEVYLLDDLTRSKQIISVVKKLIDLPKEDIIDLDINQEFIYELITLQAEKSSKELEQIINDLTTKAKDVSVESLEKLKKRLKGSSAELNELSKLLQPINQEYQNNHSIQDLSLKHRSFEEKIIAMQDQLKVETEARKKAEEEKAKFERALQLEKEKNTYLRTSDRSLSDDAKGLVHNIKITSEKISSSISNLYYKISTNTAKEKDILKVLSAIKFQAEKALKISKIITRSNFKTDKTDQIVDIVKYIEQYIELYKDIYDGTELNFEVQSNNSKLIRKISVLDMSVVFDDLISNAAKAGAKNIKIKMQNPEEDILYVIFSDDGKGISHDFSDNLDKIFELGITTTNGSGIGLNSVKTALKAMRADIKCLGNKHDLFGASFEIKFNK